MLCPPDEGDMTEEVEPADTSPWAGSDRDYTYEEVYKRLGHFANTAEPLYKDTPELGTPL